MAILHPAAEAGAVAPQLWPIEALNGLLTAKRRGQVTREVRQDFTGLLQVSPIKIDDKSASRLWSTTAHLAEHHRLTAYDATYLELALRLDAPLATSDLASIAAAQKVGAALLPTA